MISIFATMLFSSSSYAVLCGVDPTGDFFLSATKAEVFLRFSLPALKGVVDPEDAQAFLDANFRAPRAYKQAADLLESRFQEKKLTWALTDRIVLSGLEPKILQKSLKQAKVKKADIETVLRLMLGPVGYFQFKHPEVKLNVIVLPEPEALQSFMLQLEAKGTELLKETAGTGMKSSEVERLIELNQADLFAGKKEKSAEYLALLAKIRKEPMKKLAIDFRTWIESGVDLIQTHEKQLTTTILSQAGPGVVIAAIGLGAGVIERLNNECPTFRRAP